MPQQAKPQPENLSQSSVGIPPAKSSIPTWEDSLETQIASVSRQISSVEQNWQHRVDDLDLVQYRIDEVSDSLQNDTL